ncbi:acyltransferase family protein [Crystallibacter degradans]|uniref:acyltransferase family protein n=1 Tax=Crystallibacter degradans TaxID=2726743 RepID=UPI0014757E87|nr:acyltransferase family protein [Arthrobacter sp. SF27]NMR31027.1 acyltransferase family protein [Arthrobacter sp. SF27]
MLSTSSPRDYRIDTAKGILICLVVLGHFLEAGGSWRADTTRLPLTAIYMFHMPAFVFLAGVTAKTTHLGRRLGTFAVILATFQALYFVAAELLQIDRNFSVATPFWILWFLLAMFWWLLLLPVIRTFPKTTAALSVLVSAVIGVIDAVGYPLSLSRTLIFLPFFVLGATYGKEILGAVSALSAIWKSAAVFLAVAVWLFLYRVDLSQKWLYGSFGFDDLGVTHGQGILVRVGLFVVAAFVTMTFISLMPKRDGILARTGRHSLAVFALHGLVVLALTPVMPWFLQEAGSISALAACTILTAITVLVLALRPFELAIRRFSSTIVEGYTGLCRERDSASAR